MNVDDIGTLQIVSTDGKVLIEKPITLLKGDNAIQLPTSQLANGLYFIRWNGLSSNWTSSFVKTN